jgi:hypothetical protein
VTTTTDFITAVASAATAVGVLLAAAQLWLAARQATTQFEDGLNAQYREIARRLPVAALLGEALPEDAYQDALPHFYHYFDLSNEQAFLHLKGRVRPSTWKNWLEGIEQNLSRPAFRRAWAEISHRAPESFNELRGLVQIARELGPAATEQRSHRALAPTD